jgi:hypothetical protein
MLVENWLLGATIAFGLFLLARDERERRQIPDNKEQPSVIPILIIGLAFGRLMQNLGVI